tara:strand:- start:323 stop:430 length:108 start_codon:yes stop_codon:yes gene_type:complete
MESPPWNSDKNTDDSGEGFLEGPENITMTNNRTDV